MDLATLYSQKKSVLTPSPVQNTYEQFVFEMEKNGVNDLVARADADTNLAAAPNLGTYAQTSFALETAGANKLVTRYAKTPYRTPEVPTSYINSLFAGGEISQY